MKNSEQFQKGQSTGKSGLSRRKFLKRTITATAATSLMTTPLAAAVPSAKKSEQFTLGLIVGDNPDRNPADIAPGYDFWEVAGSLVVEPLSGNQRWAEKRDALFALNPPPLSVTCWFLGGWRDTGAGRVVSPNPDWELFNFWIQRMFDRFTELGVEIVTTGSADWRPAEGMSQTKGLDTALKALDLVADKAKEHNMLLALEPQGNEEDLWTTYLDGLQVIEELKRPEVKLHGDLAHMLEASEPIEDLYKAPEPLVHFHISDDYMQPGLAKRWPLPELFKILKDIEFTGGVSCACSWAGNFGRETGKTLKYLQDLREETYA